MRWHNGAASTRKDSEAAEDDDDDGGGERSVTLFDNWKEKNQVIFSEHFVP